MDAGTVHLFDRVSHHMDEALKEHAITTASPQVWILASSLNTLGAPCKLVARALQSQEDWGNGFSVSTIVVALEFPDGEVVDRFGLASWDALQARGTKEVIAANGTLPENCEWADVPQGPLFAMMSNELKDAGEEKLQQIIDQVVACVHSDLLQSDTQPSTQSHKSTTRRL